MSQGEMDNSVLLANSLAAITRLTQELQQQTPDTFSTTPLTKLEKLKERALEQGGHPSEIARASLLGMSPDAQKRYFQNLKNKHANQQPAFLTPQELADLEGEFSPQA